MGSRNEDMHIFAWGGGYYSAYHSLPCGPKDAYPYYIQNTFTISQHQLKNPKCNPLYQVWGHSGYDPQWGKIPLYLGPVFLLPNIMGLDLNNSYRCSHSKEINQKGGREEISQQFQVISKSSREDSIRFQGLEIIYYSLMALT